jgi:septal ring factor EnvC (AmiA/AmiB activator)
MRFVLLIGLALAFGLAGSAAPAEPSNAEAADRDAKWASRLLDAQVRIDRARQRVADAKAAVSEARHRKHPRGAALAEIEEERDKAQAELADAEAALPELLDRARSEGVSSAVLLRFEPEEPAAAAAD